jgi:hypothetical protein
MILTVGDQSSSAFSMGGSFGRREPMISKLISRVHLAQKLLRKKTKQTQAISPVR